MASRSSSVGPGVEHRWFVYLTLAFVSVAFSATGPVAIIMTAARDAGLSAQQTSSWLFAALAVNGVSSIFVSWRTRQPLLFLWTIPGTLFVAPIVSHYGFGAAIGTYLFCAAVLIVLGVTNLVAVLDKWVPMPVVMAMIAALFLKYVVDVVHASVSAPLVGAAMLGVFFLLTWFEQRGRCPLPPIIGALLAGAITVSASGFSLHSGSGAWIATPVIVLPTFRLNAIAEMAVPMLITMLFVQNAQGIAVLRAAGHPASLRGITVASGILTALTAPFGACPSVLAGPSNAILVSAGTRGKHYIGAVLAGVMFVAIGLFATAYARLLATLPTAFVAIIAGLALLRVLKKSFVAAFSSTVPLSALVVFVVVLSGVSFFGIGSAFWGVLAGCAVCHLIETDRPASSPRR
ncbi:benzoate/H(+) symporter BenE family transporter [Chitinasiproducens palmae]|uniref:Benzoate membrane transport protein n=1 Tax=Chitinasiproducens palmae TaxID=1770053 RepID=A0A1H2PUK2_9BURK|nr:benzoate/H(+) symporter BenE family transporter [Chitinasiproducens palmae]SDV50495.1 benzoate membrane transport protein [Chitinasiproducens palmae]